MKGNDSTFISPQPGPQTAFLASNSDIVIYGGAAGGGKSFGLLMAPLRFIGNPRFGAVIFRRTYPEISSEGGLWDESEQIYPLVGGKGSRSSMTWWFPSGASITFSHMAEAADRFRWKSAQVPFIGFDQVETFTADQFWYMLSRNRSMSGVPLWIRATCNPDPDSFIAEIIKWWVDQRTGYPVKERSGARRWFARIGNELEWADSAEELVGKYGPETLPKSVTFIAATIQDNQILLLKNPQYLANLRALPKVDNEQLERGNWLIRASAGLVFRREWMPVVESCPAGCDVVRYWDLASVEGGGDWSCGVKMARERSSGRYFVQNVRRFQMTPYDTEKAILATASQDGAPVTIGLSQDPGQAGKWEVDHLVRALDGYSVITHREEGDKVQRAKPFSAQCQAGNVSLVRGDWNEPFLRELENFPSAAWHDDQCVAEGTFVATERGSVPIETVKAGDMVLTRNGPKKVLRCWCTSERASVLRLDAEGGNHLLATGNHPVFILGSGFTPFDAISNAHYDSAWSKGKSFVSNAGAGSRQSHLERDSARFDAKGETNENEPEESSATVLTVESCSSRQLLIPRRIARIHAPIATREERRVWNMTVDEAHEYFANGILVHNCDAVSNAHWCLAHGSWGFEAPEEHSRLWGAWTARADRNVLA